MPGEKSIYLAECRHYVIKIQDRLILKLHRLALGMGMRRGRELSGIHVYDRHEIYANAGHSSEISDGGIRLQTVHCRQVIKRCRQARVEDS